MVMKFTLARRLGNPYTDNKEIEKEDERMEEEHNLFNMPQQVENVEDKVIDVNQDLEQEDQNNQDNNENVQNENVNKEDNDMGEVHELNQNQNQDTNTNWENEQREEQELKDKMRNVSSVNENSEKSENELWKFSPVLPIMKDGHISKFTIALSADELASLHEEGKLIIVSSVQRGQKLTPSGKLKDIVNMKHINSMLENVIKGRMFGGTIILNSPSEISYNPDNSTISGSSPLQIIDGMHRTKMSSKWKKLAKRTEGLNSPKDYEFTISIEHLPNEEDAKALFAEANSYSLKVNRTRTSYLDVNNFANQVVQSILRSSDIQNKIETVSTGIRASSPNIVTFGILVNAVKANYSPQTKQELEDIKNYLVKYIDKLVSIFPKFMANSNLEERNQLKSQFFTIEPLAWSGFIALSKALYGQNNWEEKLNKLNTRVQFEGWEGEFLSRENPIFRKVLREKFKIINTTGSVKWMNTVFIKFVNENKSLDEIAKED